MFTRVYDIDMQYIKLYRPYKLITSTVKCYNAYAHGGLYQVHGVGQYTIFLFIGFWI